MTIDRRIILRGGAAVAGLSALGAFAVQRAAAQVGASKVVYPPGNYPDQIVRPIEITGPKAESVIGRMPGEQRQFVLPRDKGEFHKVGSFVFKRMSRGLETGNRYEIASFAGPDGSTMPRHAHLSSHSCIIILGGAVDLELDGKVWRMMRGDFANIPANTPHSWIMRSDTARFVKYNTGCIAHQAYAALGMPLAGPDGPKTASEVPADQVALASVSGDFQPRPMSGARPEAVRVTNKDLPAGPVPYVLLDGGGERQGSCGFLAKQVHTNGQFLAIDNEGGANYTIPAHFHARHAEDFIGMDGLTLGWSHGAATPLNDGDLYSAQPRYLHAFSLREKYNRFIAFLSPGIFEGFFIDHPLIFPGGALPAPGSTADLARQRRIAAGVTGMGPDGYPLDQHLATQPLPPEDPIWKEARNRPQNQAYLDHLNMLCGGGLLANIPEPDDLKLARKLYKRPAEAFV